MHAPSRLLSVICLVGAVGCKSSSTAKAPAAPTWLATDLGPGRCLAINTAGQIVGVTDDDLTFLLSPDGTRTALGTIDPSATTVGVGIDDSGTVAGYAMTAATRTAVTFTGGVWTPIPGLGAFSAAAGVGADGAVAGVTQSADGTQLAGFLVAQGTIVPLPLPADHGSIAHATSGGNVVGSVETAAGQTHAFRVAAGAFTDLGTLGGADSTALALNAHGDVVGSAETATGERHAFLVTAGSTTLVDLGLPSGATDSDARGIDAKGRIAGNATLADHVSHPFAFQPGMPPVDLTPTDGAAQPYTGGHVAAMTADGRIVGWSVPGSSDGGPPTHCILWSPPGGAR